MYHYKVIFLTGTLTGKEVTLALQEYHAPGKVIEYSSVKIKIQQRLN